MNYQEVIDFWFNNQNKWFAKDRQFDCEINDKFLLLYQQAVKSELSEWRNSPLSMLALIIILDQFPRNIFRDDPRAFSSDKLALSLTKKALELGFNKKMPDKNHLKFLYMPLMHSEDLPDQELSLKLFKELQDEISYGHAKAHHDIILRFDRFPHRNKILNRKSTTQEIEFLTEPNSSF